MELPAMTASHGGGGAEAVAAVEKEHMFEKVVTPSDVGKLNRLVIPKQHAERYFPLDAAAAASGKGLLLSFEDRTGKPWRFRYSYWNSSQSYVMTKGWSRFVREKRLGAGDTVSFCRGVGEAARGRLFIDWRRRRPDVDVAQAPQALHRLPLPSVPIRPWAYSTYCPGVGPSRHVVLLRPQATSTTARPAAASLLASVPVRTAASTETATETTTSSKRVRLFGVNLDCPSSEASEAGTRAAPTARALPQLPPPQPSPSPVKERCSLNLGL